MAIPDDLRWIEQRFYPYSLVYLDPLVCQVGVKVPTWARLSLARMTPAQHFLAELRRTLNITLSPTNAFTYLDPQGVGTRLRSSRPLQSTITKSISNLTQSAAPSTGVPTYTSVTALLDDRNALSQPDLPDGTLCAVTAVFATKNRVPQQIKDTCPANSKPYPRSYECILTDHPPDLLTLLDQPIWLDVDYHAFHNWTQDLTRIISVGWYPFTQVIGFFTSSFGGQPYMKVLALVMKPHPHMGQIAQGPTPKDESLTTILRIRRSMVMIKRHEFAATLHAAALAKAAAIARSKLDEVVSSVTSNTPKAEAATRTIRETAAKAIDAAGSARRAAIAAEETVQAIGTTTAIPGWVSSSVRSAQDQADYAAQIEIFTTAIAGHADQIMAAGNPPATTPMLPPYPPTPVIPPRLELEQYRDLMWPVSLMQLICMLHGVNADGLKKGVRPAYSNLEQYITQLQKLHRYPSFLSSHILELAPPISVDALLS